MIPRRYVSPELAEEFQDEIEFFKLLMQYKRSEESEKQKIDTVRDYHSDSNDLRDNYKKDI